jgi:hypothetical protein
MRAGIGRLGVKIPADGLFPRHSLLISLANSMVCNQIPYAMEQGIFKRVSGKIFQGTGNFHATCFDFEF